MVAAEFACPTPTTAAAFEGAMYGHSLPRVGLCNIDRIVADVFGSGSVRGVVLGIGALPSSPVSVQTPAQRRALDLQRRRQRTVAWRTRQKQQATQAACAQSLSHCVDDQYQRVSGLLVPIALDVDAWSASRPSSDDDVRDAAAISTYINDHLPLHVCAVCGVYRGATQVQQLPASQLPMHLLRVDGPGLNRQAPVGLTVSCIEVVKYCLAPEGVGTIDNSTFSPVLASAPLCMHLS
jgi:hypothetical protein